jgi:hypothetical protein
MREKMSGMLTSLKSQLALGVSAAGLLGVVALSTVSPAYALDDDGHQNIVDTVMSLLTFNPVQAEEKPEIDYRERPPLVLPPKMDLRQPQEAGARRPDAWPQDPDVVRRKKAAAEAHWRGSSAKGNDVLSKQELMAGRAANAAPAAPEQRCSDRDHWCLYVKPDDLQKQHIEGMDDKPLVAVGEEPQREYLTQPPKGYRVATKKVQATFEAPKKDDSADPKAYWRQKNPDE